jgi:hypothetical protein
MSSIKTPVWIAPLFGGIALTTMSIASTYYVEKQLPKAKALARDFILGAVLVLCIMQILPESVASSVATLISFTSVFNFKGASDIGSINKVVESVSSVAPAIFVPDFTGSSDDTEVRVGVPRF